MAEPITLNAMGEDKPWWTEVTSYHWLVVIIASCGWLFDCMDQRIFALSREPALHELLGAGATDAAVKSWGGWATAVMMIAWATGGIIFGVLSDRWGRVKTMAVTLLIYSGFTGLSGFSRNGTEFMIYRFLVGLGIGGAVRSSIRKQTQQALAPQQPATPTPPSAPVAE